MTTEKQSDQRRVELLEQQLTIFAREFHDRLDEEDGLRAEIEGARLLLVHQLAELRDVYLMHKRHVEETIEILDLVRKIYNQLELHVRRGRIVLNSPEANAWYQACRLLEKQSSKTLLRQRQELAPYLEEDWKPPDARTWAGQLAQLAEEQVDRKQQEASQAPKVVPGIRRRISDDRSTRKG